MALLLVALYLGVFLGPSATPALGLDLRGGTQVTLTAEPLQGSGGITKSELDQAVNIIRNRVNGLGVGGADVTTQGNNHIIISVPGKGRSILATVGQTALLRFRQVLAIGNYVPTPVTTPSVTPSVSVSPSSKSTAPANGGSSKSGKKSKSHGDALSSALLAKPKPSTTPTPSATTSATPTTSPSVSPSPTGTSVADQTTDLPLPNSQSPTLTTAFETAFQNWDCSKNPDPTNGNDTPGDYIIACDAKNIAAAKYLLAPAALEGTDVKTASAGLSTQGVSWQVNLQFTGSGSGKWLSLTKTAYNATNSPDSGFAAGCSPPKGCNSVAIVLDGDVESAPAIQTSGGIPGGLADITGTFSQTQATDLANVLKYGSLPLKFTQSDTETVSATLGANQLHGGLIAGAIGLALVILFSLLYYRALGLVTIGSLAVSGLILYAVTTLLGHSKLGYTLSLPGIAGFIVAVGITADSFVVYFERLRDEVREGRRLRSAVERAWPRARRTILSADTVSLLAALILYLVSIGDVRGFAFTLGLSTLSDLLIVFFFTKPLLTVLGRRPAFDSGKAWTGIGKARAGATREADAEGPSRRNGGKEN
jgi:preprotein translocase subunit SecD